jgi:hypothetical protein
MLKEKNDCHNGEFYKQIGIVCLLSLFAGSVFVLLSTFRQKDHYADYQDRLRKAYEGLSPEEY